MILGALHCLTGALHCHCQCYSRILIFISINLTCISLNHVCSALINYLTSSIHFSPILKTNLYHIFAPFLCWYVQRSGTILRNPAWSANANTQNRMVNNQMLDNIHFLPFYFTFKKMQTQHWLCQSRTHLPICSRKRALSIGTTHWCTIVPKDTNHMGYLAKVVLGTTFFAFKRNSSVVHTQTQQ